MTPLGVVKAVRDRLSNKALWNKGMSRESDGKDCVLQACQRIVRGLGLPTDQEGHLMCEVGDVLVDLAKADPRVQQLYLSKPAIDLRNHAAILNDELGYEEAIKLLDKAIEYFEKVATPA